MEGLYEIELLDDKMADEIWNSNAHDKKKYPNFISKISSELTIPIHEQDFGAVLNRSTKMPALCSPV